METMKKHEGFFGTTCMCVQMSDTVIALVIQYNDYCMQYIMLTVCHKNPW